MQRRLARAGGRVVWPLGCALIVDVGIGSDDVVSVERKLIRANELAVVPRGTFDETNRTV
jgi:hypothetical protein